MDNLFCVFRYCVLVLVCFFSLPLLAANDIASIIQRAPTLDPNASPYPDSSLVDTSARLDAPAGKYGFVTAKDGHFYLPNGNRIRFYGINLAKDTVFIDKQKIEQLADLFARTGINMVRIHHIDDVTGILDPLRPGELRADKLDLVDYWVAQLKQRGIYLCLDLNDYRTFYSSEGVENGELLGRGAKPYAVFDQRLIELQQEYAKKFLAEHVNPYTKLAYANDPAIALLEIYDENGLFIRRDEWPTFREPYKTQFVQQWNAWLRYRYGTTATLKAAWTGRDGVSALTAGETLEQASVKLPDMALLSDPPRTSANPLRAPARVSDGAQFAYETQVNYLQVMTTYLREIGVRIPITAVGAQDVLPDLMATAETTDYIGINYYWDHPSWNAGNEWKMPSYFAMYNPVTDNAPYSFPALVSMARMHGRPLVVRELGYCFPNPYRGVGMLESAAYGAFLDLDAMILFTYDAGVKNQTIGYFDIHLDPLRWGLVSSSARLFLSGEVATASRTIGIGSSQVDAFTWKSYMSPLYQQAYATKLFNYTITGKQHPFDLLVTSGRSCGGNWGSERLLLFANQRHTDTHYQGISDGMDTLHGYDIKTGAGGSFPFIFRGVGYDAGSTRSLQAWPCYSLADLRTKNLLPVATANTAAMGFIDPKKHVIGFKNLQETVANRVALDALRDWYNAPVSHLDPDMNRWRTDTGQIERNLGAKVLRVDTPTIQALAGRFDSPFALQTSTLRLSTPTTLGTLSVESLDGKPLTDSKRYLIKMTSRARNDQLSIAPSTDGPKPYKLTSLGEPPIFTDGKASAISTVVALNGNVVIDLHLEDGTWEYLVEPGRALLFLDTPDIQVHIPDSPKEVRFYTASGQMLETMPTDGEFTVPGGIRYSEIIW